MDVNTSDSELQREVIELYGERYRTMSVNDRRHIIEAYTSMVWETARPKAKEIPMSQRPLDMVAEGSDFQRNETEKLNAIEEMQEDNSVRIKTEKANIGTLEKLDLIIKQVYFDAILCGEKHIEYRELKDTNRGMLTRIDEKTGKRELRQPQVLKLYAGYNSDRDALLVEVKKTLFFNPNQIEYHLGKVLEYDIKKKTADRLMIDY